MTEPTTDHAPCPRRRLALHWKILIGLIFGAALGIGANVLATRPVTPGVVDPFDQNQNGIDDRLDWAATNVADPLGRVFLRLIFMVVIPLVFSALALGALEMGNLGRLGRVGLRTLGFTVLLSAVAVALGLFLVNTIRPGYAISEEQGELLRAHYSRGASDAVAKARLAKPLRDTLLDIIPENPLQEMVGALDASSKGNGMLAVMFFALIFGVAIIFTRDRCETLVGWLEGLNAVSVVIIHFAMRLAPAGVACLVFAATARVGLALVPPLVGFMFTVVLGLTIQLCIVYPLVLWWSGRRPGEFFRGASEAMFTAFGTSSSNATLPTSLEVAQTKLKLPRDISNFVLTIGATGNQNGTALYEGVVVLFLAQVFHVDLSLGQQLLVVLMSVLAGVGTAGVPGGSLPLVVVVLQSVGVPGEGIGMILGVDRVLDMYRTVLNVTGDLTIAACVTGRSETVALALTPDEREPVVKP
jgi:DAACS family dicarboxylate/amino acid:cation (Na+ or H+) symporter